MGLRVRELQVTKSLYTCADELEVVTQMKDAELEKSQSEHKALMISLQENKGEHVLHGKYRYSKASYTVQVS